MNSLNCLTEIGFVTIGEVRDGARTFEDTQVLYGDTYVYQIIPISPRLVQGTPGYVTHHIETRPNAQIPDKPGRLRLQGQAEGVFTYEGPDIIVEWDPPANSGAFTGTRLIQDYCVEIWGADTGNPLLYRLHPKLASPEACVTEPRFHYRQQLNTEDSIQAGKTGPQRWVTIRVWARTRDGIVSSEPAQITVNNAAPDMSSFLPTMSRLVEGVRLRWPNFVPPRDLDRYRVLIDTVTAPRTNGLAVVDEFVDASSSQFLATNLIPNTTYYGRLIPYDTFGIGFASQTASAETLIPAQQWSFFVTQFDSSAIVFTVTEPSISWTAGTLNYVDARGQAQAQAIAAGSATRALSQSLFIYYVLGEAVFRSSQDPTEVFRSDQAVMAVYNGGPTFILVDGQKMSGTDIIAGTIGAQQLVVGQAVITEQAQMAAATIGEAQIIDASIATAKIQDAAVQTAKIADAAIQTAKIEDAAIVTAKIGDLQVETIKVADGAITGAAVDEVAGSQSYAAGSHVIISIIRDLTDIASVALTAIASTVLNSGETCDMRIRRGTTILHETRAQNNNVTGVLQFPIMAHDITDVSGLNGNHTFDLQIAVFATGQIDLIDPKLALIEYKK